MLLYTMKISDILEGYAYPVIDPKDPWNPKSVDKIIEEALPKFFDFSFPWYDENNEGLNTFKDLFLRYHYEDQIGQETLTNHKLCLQSELIKIMPYYTELWKSIKMEYDPLVNRIRTTESTAHSNSTSQGSTEVNDTLNRQDDTQNVHSENPEVSVSDNNFASTMDRGKAKRVDTQTGTTDTSMSGEANNQITEKFTGFEGNNQSESIIAYRNAIVNINQRILEDTNFLFMKYHGGLESVDGYYLF